MDVQQAEQAVIVARSQAEVPEAKVNEASGAQIDVPDAKAHFEVHAATDVAERPDARCKYDQMVARL